MNRYYESEKIVQDYAKYRPQYDQAIATNIINHIKKHYQKTSNEDNKLGFMVDVGCGGGQSTTMFAPYFDKILGIDASPNQIKTALNHSKLSHIDYKVCSAENLPVSEKSVDVIVSGEAVHWFDTSAFLKEVDRVLKPGGCLALFGYWMPIVIKIVDMNLDHKCTEATKLIEDTVVSVIKQADRYTQVGILQGEYKDVYQIISYNNKQRLDDHIQTYKWNLNDLLGYLNSIDSFDVAPKSIDQFENSIRNLLGVESKSSKDINMEVNFVFFSYLAFK